MVRVLEMLLVVFEFVFEYLERTCYATLPERCRYYLRRVAPLLLSYIIYVNYNNIISLMMKKKKKTTIII